MSILNLILTFDKENAYESAYDLSVKKNYSTPKIYSAKGDLSQRWYVYFSFRHPETGKLKRITPIYGNVNKYKTKEERLYILSAYSKKLLELLKAGFDPYVDNTQLYQKTNQQKTTLVPVQEKPHEPKAIKEEMYVEKAFELALSIKKNIVGNKTYTGYQSKVNRFLNWLKHNKPEVTAINQLSKGIVQEYLNEVLQETSPRNRNNTRVDLNSLMQVLEDNEIVTNNFIKTIPNLKAVPKRNKTYTKQTQEEIYSYLEQKDTHLLLFIKFISYNFLRPVEVCRIQIKDINITQKTVSFKAKNKALKTKIIPDILLEELPDLKQFKKDDYLFGMHKLGGKWETTEENKRDYFTKRFKKVVKDHFNLGSDYGLYSFRHTYITKLYREIRKTATPFEAKSRLKLITGHSSMAALEKYLRDIDAELPVDYSDLIKA